MTQAPKICQWNLASFISANYFQIGETKYGKPIIDRVVQYDTSIDDVAKCLLVGVRGSAGREWARHRRCNRMIRNFPTPIGLTIWVAFG